MRADTYFQNQSHSILVIWVRVRYMYRSCKAKTQENRPECSYCRRDGAFRVRACCSESVKLFTELHRAIIERTVCGLFGFSRRTFARADTASLKARPKSASGNAAGNAGSAWSIPRRRAFRIEFTTESLIFGLSSLVICIVASTSIADTESASNRFSGASTPKKFLARALIAALSCTTFSIKIPILAMICYVRCGLVIAHGARSESDSNGGTQVACSLKDARKLADFQWNSTCTHLRIFSPKRRVTKI